ncbi:putative zinc-finger of transcription factor IIIC complex-domain-containing protein [Rhodotorula diobovata]|uniref:Putative zinc-finger of transcription factor IIIC complex-domain-containing protein n=1 Tax=Rhodotorula diobovata TaxID=5288 RepID=A0A5C5G5H0_9BASI|nr:putative zinc-finger of transcription factor IIIC complex-domain-containing protein [Rhodotorula diobovata]
MDPPSPVILGSSNVPYSPSSPSPSALVRSPDGQLAAVARGEIHIFTPALGYTDAAKAISANGALASSAGTKGGADALAAASKGKGREGEMPMLRSTIPVDKRNIVKWADWADEYDLALPAGAEPFWRSATWSPSGMSALGGCILATLTTNAEVLLFESPKNGAKGEWFETADLTSLLINEIVTDHSSKATATRTIRRELVAELLQCQTSSLAWSSAIPGTAQDLSLLALGHRSGDVTLWQLDDERRPVRVARFRPQDETNVLGALRWSDWTLSTAKDDIETATAQLAIADADGRVFAVPVSQALNIKASVGAKRNYELGNAVRVADADGRAATQLEWVPTGGKMQLAYTKLGTAHLAQLTDAQVVHEWEVELETVGGEQWMGATSWAPAAGLQYLPSRDALLVTLSSGSFHLLHLPSCHSSPLLHDTMLSSTYTSAARACFVTSLERARQHKDRFKAEGHGAVTRREGAKVLGVVALTSGNDDMDVAWVFETTRPDVFAYRTPADTRTHFVLANLAGADGPDGVLSAIDRALAAPKNVRTNAPLATLGPLLHALAAHIRDPAFVAALLLKLQALPVPPAVPPASETAFEEKLEATLNADEGLGRVRAQEALARGLLKHRAVLSPEHDHLAVLAQLGLARQLIKETLGRLTAVLGATPLSDVERPYHARLLLASASLFPPTPTDPAAELLPADALAQAYEAREATCPACKAHVPLANVRYACCEKGHQWERCSLSLALIASVQVRTCSSCERKALLPDALRDLPADGPVRRMLQAAKACVMCGGRWVRVR